MSSVVTNWVGRDKVYPANVIHLATEKFMSDFYRDNTIDWEKLVQFNSGT